MNMHDVLKEVSDNCGIELTPVPYKSFSQVTPHGGMSGLHLSGKIQKVITITYCAYH